MYCCSICSTLFKYHPTQHAMELLFFLRETAMGAHQSVDLVTGTLMCFNKSSTLLVVACERNGTGDVIQNELALLDHWMWSCSLPIAQIMPLNTTGNLHNNIQFKLIHWIYTCIITYVKYKYNYAGIIVQCV